MHVCVHSGLDAVMRCGVRRRPWLYHHMSVCVHMYPDICSPPILQVAMARTLCVHHNICSPSYIPSVISRCDDVISSLHPLFFSSFPSLFSPARLFFVFFSRLHVPSFRSFLHFLFYLFLHSCDTLYYIILCPRLSLFPRKLLSDDGCQVRGCMYAPTV